MSEPPEPSSTPPEGEGGALYHDRFAAPPAYHLLFLALLLIQIAAVIAGRAPIFVPLLTGLPLVLIWLLFAVIRVSVTRAEVEVQLGLSGRAIPIACVEQCEVVEGALPRRGGWGLREGEEGSTVLAQLGNPGQAVRIAYRKGGATRTLLLPSRDPARLAWAVRRARAAATGGERSPDLP